ncbi:hypothetical protein CSV79_01530 [Sporosarcina sp. P13]|uniref:hypothetical protein n=1 Tax=Sporosarcina sp. P13 TaxID=2048263 RepID=UPI000C16DC03|nr:hypothetical protein [Sporosarcina sp. P13]PIC65330.1 hypothetical protein CSV79_01530 [Sporosarcina sp. P13]
MAEEYSFFNDVNGDREYDMEAFATYFKQFLSNGLYHTDNMPALKISHVNGLQTKIDPGCAYIEGFMYRNTEDILFTHDQADATNARVDRIVLRLDRNVNARYIKAFIKKGTPATNPKPPTLQRDSVIYEISLAQVKINAGATTIATIKDERLDPAVAGLVSSLITIPTDGFIQEWNAFMEEMESAKGQYETSLASWMSQLNQDKVDYENAWESWFNGIQNQIGVRTLIGTTEPAEAVAGDLWIKTIG